MIAFLVCYVLIAAIWGKHCIDMQEKYYPESSTVKYLLTYVLNFLFWWIAIPIALKNGNLRG